MTDIKLNVTEKNLYKYYVDLLNPFLKLPEREKKVLSSLMLIYYKNKHNPDIDSLLLSKDTRKGIRTALNISEASFNNSIMVLRRKSCLVDNSINKSLIKYPEDKTLNIHYILHIV